MLYVQQQYFYMLTQRVVDVLAVASLGISAAVSDLFHQDQIH